MWIFDDMVASFIMTDMIPANLVAHQSDCYWYGENTFSKMIYMANFYCL